MTSGKRMLSLLLSSLLIIGAFGRDTELEDCEDTDCTYLSRGCSAIADGGWGLSKEEVCDPQDKTQVCDAGEHVGVHASVACPKACGTCSEAVDVPPSTASLTTGESAPQDHVVTDSNDEVDWQNLPEDDVVTDSNDEVDLAHDLPEDHVVTDSNDEVDLAHDLSEDHVETDSNDESELAHDLPKSCEKGPDTTKTVELIFIVTGEEDGPKILTKRSRENEVMNCGGSFYMQCKCDEFHPGKDETTGACYAPTPEELPTTYGDDELDEGEANQLAYAAKKLFHNQNDLAKTIEILERKGIKRMTVEGDGQKTYRVYPVPLASNSKLDKIVESKEFQKLKCSEIIDEDNTLNAQEYFRDLLKQLKIKGCE